MITTRDSPLVNAITDASDDDLINDLAQLIKAVSAISSHNANELITPNREPGKTASLLGFAAIMILLINELNSRNALPDKNQMKEAQAKLYPQATMQNGVKREHDDLNRNMNFYADFISKKEKILGMMEKITADTNAIDDYYKKNQRLAFIANHKNKRNNLKRDEKSDTKHNIAEFKVIDLDNLPTTEQIKRHLITPSPEQLVQQEVVNEADEISFEELFEPTTTPSHSDTDQNEKKEERQTNFEEGLEQALKKQRDDNEQIENQQKIDTLIQQLTTTINKYKDSGRVNAIGRLFAHQAKHTDYASVLLSKIMNINATQKKASEKLTTIEKELENANTYLKTHKSVRLLDALSSMPTQNKSKKYSQ